MTDAPRVLLWPVVVPRWRWGTDWCAAGRVVDTLDALQASVPVVEPGALRDREGGGVVLAFGHPTAAFLERVAPVLLERSLPFAVFVTTAWVRTRAPRSGRPDAPAVTWTELRSLAEAGATIGVRAHDALDVARLPDELAFRQLATARLEVQRRVGVTPWLHCDPSSPSRPGIVAMATELGFEVQVVRGPVSRLRDDARRPAFVPRPWQTAGSIARRLAGSRKTFA